MNIIFGRNGQVARCLADLLTQKGDTQNWRFVGSDECNFENPENIRNFLELLQVIPTVILLRTQVLT
jgi:dTDP-4-dehydrorhamnose reductase